MRDTQDSMQAANEETTHGTTPHGNTNQNGSTDTTDTCAICLVAAAPRLTACGHPFCDACLCRYTSRAWPVSCPMCKQRLTLDTLHAAGCTEPACPEIETESAPPPVLLARAERDFARVARAEHMRRCPSCSAPIVKAGGCDHMRCGSCQHSFSWSSAVPVVQCHAMHFRRENTNDSRLLRRCCGITCPGCSPIARVKLLAWRMTVVPVGAVVLAACASPVIVAGGAVAFAAGVLKLKDELETRLQERALRQRSYHAAKAAATNRTRYPAWCSLAAQHMEVHADLIPGCCSSRRG